MHRIHFENRSIVICSQEETVEDSADTLVVRTGDEEGTYRKFCAWFKEVDAGGGLVSDGKGNYLLIERNGLWDLPKGHRDEGEDIRDTAVREVNEETGAAVELAGDLICITDHCYLRDGIWHLKHTWWFNMICSGRKELKPQTEEDISRAVWASVPELDSLLENTYPSIKEVFRNSGL